VWGEEEEEEERRREIECEGWMGKRRKQIG
jgi:hypothetical protein